ncbi:hypothetical protein HWV62_17440 [Athelia sp. TMB]|nr:hypothetical protein HWV62_17440 [Athelia sp. TMB]
MDAAIAMLASCNLTPAAFVAGLVESEEYNDHARDLFMNHSRLLLDGLDTYLGPSALTDKVQRTTQRAYTDEILALSHQNAGLRFRASKANAAQVAGLSLQDMGLKMQELALKLWKLLDILLSADMDNRERRLLVGKAAQKRARRVTEGRKAVDLDGDELMAKDPESAGSEEEYWRESQKILEAPSSEELESERSEALINIVSSMVLLRDEKRLTWLQKKIMCLSVMVQSTNRRCNAMQSVIGMFLQSAGTPETIVELLSRLGVSITMSSINNTVHSLTSESTIELKRIGRTLLAAYAYDNVDIDLKHVMPTGDARENTLIHLTSGTFIRLDHGVTSGELACSEYLWRRSKRNPRVLAVDVPPMTDYIKLLDIHPESDHPSGLTRRECFNHWVFLRDLITHGPPYFRQFRRMLAKPEAIDQIPVVKSRQVPCRIMDINPSSNAMNVNVIEDLCRQAGVGDSAENPGVTDINDQVIIIHGDLLTGERIESIQDTRSIEEYSGTHPGRCK